MAWSLTPFGYEVDGSLSPLVTVEEFHELTDNRYATDSRIGPALDACSLAVRKACGWHVAGNVACRATMDGGERKVWLPSNHVTAVTRVEVLGSEVTAFEWSHQGQVRVPTSPDVLRAMVIEYVAGYEETPADVAELIVDHVSRILSASRGVAQETAGSVSISYAQSFAAEPGGARLSRADRDALAGYRLVEAI